MSFHKLYEDPEYNDNGILEEDVEFVDIDELADELGYDPFEEMQ